MSEPLRPTSADRVLVIAPHPDDEAIACGGLLLAARDAGAARRVVTLTDGDNNPWPQRWLEKRWRIDAAARVRWGACRRAEAQAALDLLGVATDERAFLAFPDTALTSLLMRDAGRIVDPLRAQIAAFAPTHIAFPALADRHPDHSAAHIALRLAAAGAGSTARLIAFRVHGTDGARAAHVVELDPARRGAKRAAIACHHTQMALSSARFLAFATERESYDEAVAAPPDDHPLRATLREGRILELRLHDRRLHGNRQALILFGDARGKTDAWWLPLARPEQTCELRDARDDHPVAAARWRDEADGPALALPLPHSVSPHVGFVKLARPRTGLVVFDRYGWQAVELV
ncbi:MAG: PIG-L family deacetylase [Rudaea sp.]|uniref:PIG-L deacetylase family protein n=1 Tax=Rudaea sp. TaxID=2136325 RepID=UPI0039E72996